MNKHVSFGLAADDESSKTLGKCSGLEFSHFRILNIRPLLWILWTKLVVVSNEMNG